MSIDRRINVFSSVQSAETREKSTDYYKNVKYFKMGRLLPAFSLVRKPLMELQPFRVRTNTHHAGSVASTPAVCLHGQGVIHWSTRSGRLARDSL